MSNELDALMALLDRRGTAWTDATAIGRIRAESAGDNSWTNRVVTQLASDSRGAIISTGAGYKLAKHATPTEILESYRISMRRALATHHRANEIVSYARRNRLLPDDVRTDQIKHEIRKEITNKPEPPAVQRQPETDLFGRSLNRSIFTQR